MTFAEAAMIMMSDGKANIKSLTITQNGQYNAPAGIDGYNPVIVNVPKNIQSITITRNGTYTAPAGVDGYNPVIVDNPYEILWKQEHGQTEVIDTGLTDSEGNPIIIDGIPVDDIDDVVNSGFIPGHPFHTTFAALSESGMIYVNLQYNETVITPDWETQYDISVTVTNAQTGESKTASQTVTGYGSKQYPIAMLDTAYNINYSLVVYTGGIPTGAEAIVYPSDVGVTGEFKYYVCKPEE